MKNNLTILFLFFGCLAFGQKVQVEAFNFKLSDPYMEEQADDLYFPVIHTGNENIDVTINNNLRNRIMGDEYSSYPLDSALNKWGGNELVSIGFIVTYNEKGILSFNISTLICGANCSGTTDYFNYSTVSGKLLEVSDVINLTEEFKALVKKDKVIQYAQEKIKLTKELNSEDADIDQEGYEIIVSSFEACGMDEKFKSFSISKDALTIYHTCNLPYEYMSYTPEISLEYPKSVIKKFLKIKI